MRYTHGFKIIRHRKHRGIVSITISALVLVLILLLGFRVLDAQQFFVGFAESFGRVAVAYVISIVIAGVLMLSVAFSPTIETLMLPILDVLQSFPSFALYPLFVVWFGRSSVVPIMILIVEMVWPLLFTALSAQKQIHPDVIFAAKSFGAKGWKFLIYVLVPLLFPAIITGSIVAWGEAWEAIIAAEIIVNVPGVGTYLAHSGTDGHSGVLLIGIFSLLLLLYLVNKYLWLPLLNLSTKYQTE